MPAWTPQQASALSAISRWLRRRDQQVFRLDGYAGTGKTSLAGHVAAGVDGEVVFAAFTGKAAYVMRRRGCANAATIHRLIYRLTDKDERGRPVFALDSDSSVRRARLVVIDEGSMVGERIARDLLSFGIPVLVIGDPAQLPPVDGSGFFTRGEPDAMLTEIHRQALDNPIVRMATDVREGRRLEYGDYGESKVVAAIDGAESAASDQVLVGRNRTRRNINSGLRERRGLIGAYPFAGDKLVCLRNDYRGGFMNGSLWVVDRVVEASSDGEIALRVAPEEGGPAVAVTTHARFFDGVSPPPDGREYTELDYGYALTVHKAQGSQWDRVVLHDESGYFGEHRSRWLYTGVTRAAERVTVVVRR